MAAHELQAANCRLDSDSELGLKLMPGQDGFS